MRKKYKTIDSMIRPLRDFSLNDAVIALYELRSQVAPEKYQELADSFKGVARKRQEGLTRRLKNYSDVYWLPNAQAVSAAAEYHWASICLSPITNVLTLHAVRLREMQEKFDDGDFDRVFSYAEQSVAVNGWSIFASELMLASAYASGDVAKGTKISSDLQRIGAGRISGLLAKMAADRNNPSIPFASFEARCKEFFARIDDPYRHALYKARVLSIIEDNEQWLKILAFDAMSSYVDYYETLIQAAASFIYESQDEMLRDSVKKSLSSLIKAGLEDDRIDRILMANEQINIEDALTSNSNRSDLTYRCTSLGSAEPLVDSPWLSKMHKCVTLTDSLGLAADNEVDELVRAGVNFQGLPVGKAMWLKGMQPFIAIDSLPIFLSGLDYDFSNQFFALLSKDDNEVLLAMRNSDHPVARSVIATIDHGVSIDFALVPNSLCLWLSRYLIKNGKSDLGRVIAIDLKNLDGVWKRYGSKLDILAASAVGDVEQALRGCADQLSIEPRLAYELPIGVVIEGKAWRDLAHLPSWLVAMVYHFANFINPTSNNRFICRMACRNLYKQMQLCGPREYIASRGRQDKELLCSFLRIGWTEENLSLIEELASTQEVRRERLKIFQVLLELDDANADSYRGMIQALTLDETLWSGLREIDSNRIFVNEPAISRWAEKELAPEYERWRLLRQSELGSEVSLEKILRTYLLDHDMNALLEALPIAQQSEAGAIILEIVNKLFSRFLLDPANGLNSYLSLRVRHGTLRGVLLGPIEEERLLLSGEYSEEEFNLRWRNDLSLAPDERTMLRDELIQFSASLDSLARWIVDEKVQIFSSTKKEGMFPSQLDVASARILVGAADPSMSFGYFLSQCYFSFWKILQPYRVELSKFILGDFSSLLQTEFHAFIERLSEKIDADLIRPLIVELHALATRSVESCRVIAEWFLPATSAKEQTYPVSAALEIARKATANVYREFQSELKVEGDETADIGLSTTGLSILYDSLFVIFSNAWVHSGRGASLGPLNVKFRYCERQQVLGLRVENKLSERRAEDLRSGQLNLLKEKYTAEVPLDLVPVEGGSGFAKLARIAAAVNRSEFPDPLVFGVNDDGKFFVDLSIQLYQRDGVFDAYL